MLEPVSVVRTISCEDRNHGNFPFKIKRTAISYQQLLVWYEGGTVALVGPQGTFLPARDHNTADGLDLWLVDCERDPAAAGAPEDDLTDAETAQLCGYAAARAGRTFATARSILRRVLALYIDLPPRQVPIVIAASGKPCLAGTDLFFNLAHAWPLVAIAVSRRGEVGVDVEVRRREVDVALLADRVLTPFERADVHASHDPRGAFLTYWTIKEAVAKATSRGLRLDPRLIVLDRSPLAPARRLRANAGAFGKWCVTSRDVGACGILAVASQFPHEVSEPQSLPAAADDRPRPRPVASVERLFI